jgi:serine acetyltransferase
MDRIIRTGARGRGSPAVSGLQPGSRVRLRRLLLLAAAFLPLSIKRQIYRWGFGYRIGRGVAIGVAYLDCATLTVADGARIGHGVIFCCCGDVRIGRNAKIGPLTLVRGGARIELGDYSLVRQLNVINAIPGHDCINHPDSSFYLGYGAVITGEHRIDFTDRVSIGRCSVLGGRNSSIWTHTCRIGKPVEIGSYCYLGSEIRIAPGARVPDCSVVAMGSVVTRPVGTCGSLIAGVPATKKRQLTPSDRELIFRKTRPDLPDESYPDLPMQPRPLAQRRHTVSLKASVQRLSYRPPETTNYD